MVVVENSRIFNILVLASGSGTTFSFLTQASQKAGSLFRICGLITNRDDIGALDKAEEYGVPITVVSSAQFPFDVWESELLRAISSYRPDLIVLAGFLKKVPLAAVKDYKGKIINTHPSLLPKFGGRGMYGTHVHKAVFEARELESGVTIHWVSENYDEGAVIGQQRVDIRNCKSFEEVEKLVQSIEKPFLVDMINDLLTHSASRL